MKSRELVRDEIKSGLEGYLKTVKAAVAAVGGYADDYEGLSPVVTVGAGGSGRPQMTAVGLQSSFLIRVFLKVMLLEHSDPETILDTLEQYVAEWVEAHPEGTHYTSVEYAEESGVVDMEGEDGVPWLWEVITLRARTFG